MSVQTGADLEKDVYGGLLTEVGQSNMPSGGSPANLNVEFLPGLARTRGGLQRQTSYQAIPGGPWQVRYTKSYGQVPENQTELAMLVNPTSNAQAMMANGPITTFGNITGYGAQEPWAPFIPDPGWGGPLAKSSTQFGREYIAISEGRYGYDLPRQWDGTFFDRVSTCGPGLAPTAADSVLSTLIKASALGLNQFSPTIDVIFQIGNTVTALFNVNSAALSFPLSAFAGIGQIGIAGTSSAFDGMWTPSAILTSPNGEVVTGFQYINPTTGIATASTGEILTGLTLVTAITAPPFPPQVGTTLTIAGAGVSAYDGTWPITVVPIPPVSPPTVGNTLTSAQMYIMINAAGVSNSGGGSFLNPGSVVGGLHQVSVAFITRQGYITRPAPPSSFTASGGLTVDVSNIPTGPSNIVARLLIFTPFLTPPAMTGTFYSIRQTTGTTATVMQINDNTTISLNVNFSDSDLLSGFNAQYLFGLVELGECAGSFPYAGRMFWYGELNMLQDFYNLEFNGGWDLGGGTDGSDLPLGWTSGPHGLAGGGSRIANGGTWQDAYQITTNGAGNIKGLILQTAFQNYLGTALVKGSTSYSVRITALAGSAASPVTVFVVLFSIMGGGILGAAQATFSSTTFSTQILPIGPGLTPSVTPSDAQLQLYAEGPIGATVTIDRIEPFPTNQPINYTVVRASYVQDPESFDGVTGLLQPIYSNGDAVRTVYPLRDSMYVSAGRSTFVTKDVPGSEPALWTIDSVSDAIGAVGANAAAGGEDWEVKVNRYGLYMYLGREPEKISQEIQSLWNKQGAASQINWKYGYKIWATVDLQNKRVYIGAPINGAIECNCIFVMDYNTLDTSEMIAQYPTLRFSPYTGKRVILEQGRKWTQWTFQPPASLELPAGSNLPVPCGTFLEQSDGTAQFVLGGGADNNVYFIDPTNRGNDNGQPCLSYYTTHFSPTQDEEQAAQAESGPMRGHMHLFSFLRKYVQGVGKLAIFRYTNTLVTVGVDNPKLIGSIDLQNPASTDAELTIDDAKGERFAISWQTNTLNSWWEAQRYIPVLECDPNNLVRGTNMQ